MSCTILPGTAVQAFSFQAAASAGLDGLALPTVLGLQISVFSSGETAKYTHLK